MAKRDSQQPPPSPTNTQRFKINVKAELLDGGPRHDAALMASYGLAGKYIASQTGLKTGAVYYACKKAGVRITDYRNGLSNVASIVRRLTQKQVDQELYRHLRSSV